MSDANLKTDRVARNTRQFTQVCAFLRSAQHQLRAPRKPADRKPAEAALAAHHSGASADR